MFSPRSGDGTVSVDQDAQAQLTYFPHITGSESKAQELKKTQIILIIAAVWIHTVCMKLLT